MFGLVTMNLVFDLCFERLHLVHNKLKASTMALTIIIIFRDTTIEMVQVIGHCDLSILLAF
jgi:hypothetical protein